MSHVSDNLTRCDELAAQWWRFWTHDFCPSWQPFFITLKRPLTMLAIAAVTSLVAGLTVAPQGFVVAGALAVVLGLGVAWPKLVMRGLSGEVLFRRERAREGEVIAAVLRITNRWPFPLWGLALEHGFRSGEVIAEADAVELALARIPGWSRSEFTWDFVPSQRGEYPLQTPRLTTSFPFGMCRATRDVAVQSRVIVWPRVLALSALPLLSGENWAGDALHERRAGHDGETIGLRPFRPGDSPRHVHWAQTARQSQLIVRERQVHSTGGIRIVLDADADSHVVVHGESSLEWCVRWVASLVQMAWQNGVAVECVLDGETVAVGAGPNGRRRFNDRLALYEPVCETGRSNGDVRSTSPRFDSRRLTVIVVTTDLSAGRQQDLRGDARRLVFDTSRNSDPERQLRRLWEQECNYAWQKLA